MHVRFFYAVIRQGLLFSRLIYCQGYRIYTTPFPSRPKLGARKSLPALLVSVSFKAGTDSFKMVISPVNQFNDYKVLIRTCDPNWLVELLAWRRSTLSTPNVVQVYQTSLLWCLLLVLRCHIHLPVASSF